MASGHRLYTGYDAVELGHPVAGQRLGESSDSTILPGNVKGSSTLGGSPAMRGYDAEQAQPFPPGMPVPSPNRPTSSRSSSWDLLSGIKKFEHSYEGFDTRNATEAHLVYADGDLPKNKACLALVEISLLLTCVFKVSKFYNYLLNVSIVTRWILFIFPILGALWIPGIIGVTRFPKVTVRSSL